MCRAVNKVLSQRILLLPTLLLMLGSPQSWAERAMLSGELGLWLSQTAVPELTETLAEHPKFSGEPIRIAAVSGAQVSSHSTLLADAIRQQLTHAVLRRGRNNVANSQDPALCNKVPLPVYYLVGIRIEPLSRSNHRVSLAVLDLENSMWVSGVSLTWQGRLLSSERAALATPVREAPAGSVENPLPLTVHAELTQALYDQLQCRLPPDLRGSLSVVSPTDPRLQTVLHDLQDKLALSAQAVSRDATAASWLLHADLQPVADNLQLLTLDLGQNAADAARQRLASVYVSAQRHSPGGVFAPAAASPALLGEFAAPARDNECASSACARIQFELYEEAYLLVFRTHYGNVAPLDCGHTVRKKAAGQQQYRLRADTQQRVGFYVIASRERHIIQSLQQHFRTAPGACKAPVAEDPEWLHTALDQLTQHASDLEWRAIHVINTPQGPQQL